MCGIAGVLYLDRERPVERAVLKAMGDRIAHRGRDAEKVLFGSEIKALLAHPGVRPTLDPCALEDYLAYGIVPGPRSIFREIEKLQPAHTLAVERGITTSPRRYWQLRLEPDRKPT